MSINFGKTLYTIIYVLIAIIASMLFLSYFNISLKSNITSDEKSNITLNRVAVFEGYGKNYNENNDIINAIM